MVLIFALIPVLGGVIKGVGLLVLKVGKDVAQNRQLALEIIAFLNRIGHKNAEAWLKALKISAYESEILAKFGNFCDTILLALSRTKAKLGGWLPQAMLTRLEQLQSGFGQLKQKGNEMIPQAIKDLDSKLKEIQQYIRSGGQTTAGATSHAASTGQKTTSYVEEARLNERGGGAAKVAGGRFTQNAANPKKTKQIAQVYDASKVKEGWPDLMAFQKPHPVRANESILPDIAAFNGKISAVEIKGPRTIYRVVNIGEKPNNPAGAYWTLEKPASGKEFREKYAVLDEFNKNGHIIEMELKAGETLKAWQGKVSEQFGATGQYLPGGAQQLYVDLGKTPEIKARALATKPTVTNWQVDGHGYVDGVKKSYPVEWLGAKEIQPK